MHIIIAGIDTEVGKTLVSAILTTLFQAEYWKPIQSGSLNHSDSAIVHELSGARCHPESYRFTHSLAAHQAAQIDNIPMNEETITLPKTDSSLIIETSGGFLSPCTYNSLQGDVFAKWPCHWVLVSKAYLGSINHTCLTIEAMQARNLSILGIILNQYSKEEEDWLLNMTGLPFLGRLNYEKTISKAVVQNYANLWRETWKYREIQ
ncbi:dethiobiotin synthase [Chlamydia psittaci]|uniref:dethiobiotin synthase n=1 Tax=Chlamydia psittaci TaxID=83554 RepID=UPI00027E18C3|nr:dethiobiotin synthase [Chlamydia psittaci]AFS21572.1 dethiobiotin synthase [Chlamydia psittaci MN]AFS27218.1 dethiobiotin synthase [Chlamydia psittaci CP3]KPZ36788.1 ATP-dependent dethiobiotin synthetase BioD [Chlamydia psittaci CP3]KPZ38788.1 ATP-dependent dethiobiotin synthetase BioD [Chlamydia psittaci str. Frances]MBE3636156.1 dethiobiotin synthase [Chlamydia psittaci]